MSGICNVCHQGRYQSLWHTPPASWQNISKPQPLWLPPIPVRQRGIYPDSGRSALETGFVSKGDLVVITAGHPVGVMGSTNILRVKRL